jgi:Brp/Blh family beta-carotene 15,15'-monooxygenase
VVAVSEPGGRGAGRDRLARLCLGTGLASLAATALVALAVSVPLQWQYAVLVAGGLLVGLPHGAVDWAALGLGRNGAVTARGALLVGAVYLALGGLYLAVWFVAPVLAAVAFILLTVVHWGQGDRYTLRSLYGATYLEDGVQAALTIALRGALPMALPLVAFPATYRSVVGTFVEPFGADVGAWWVFGSDARLAVGAAVLGLTVLTLARARPWLGPARRPWRLDVIEIATLWLFFSLVPPVLAIGVYFACWHSLRHVARLWLLDPPSAAALAAGRWGRPIARFVAAATPPSVATLGLVAALWVAVPAPAAGLAAIAGLALVAIAVVTAPHLAVVGWLDRLAYDATGRRAEGPAAP